MTITTLTGKGNFALLKLTSKRPDSSAGFRTGYLNTEGKCLEMFYRPTYDENQQFTFKNKPSLAVYVRSEDTEESDSQRVLHQGNYS